ncbi:MAG: transposase [Xenococcus sp. (in: cyanobacteria)]
MTLYKNKYRIESTRLPNRDYSANGYYFVTICTYKKFCYFGNIVNDRMKLSQVGKIAQKHWQEIPNHFNHVYIDAYVIMPNHVHGIVTIDRPIQKSNVETRNFASLQSSLQSTNKSNKFAPLKPGSLQAIIHAYKASVTRWCRKNGDDIFRWQPRFYEHIIRNDDSLNNIRQYIVNNPLKWSEDSNNPMHHK